MVLFIMKYAFKKKIFKLFYRKGNYFSLEKIAKFTAEYYDVNYNELLGSGRAQKVSEARHMAVYLSREITNISI